MAKAQYPIDGMLGKDWKVTSYMGMRIHPVTKVKKHHNGTDIWSPHSPCYIEAPVNSKVVYAGPSKAKNSDGSVGGFGYYVILIHMIDGLWYTSLYAHMEKGSLKVKTGQKIEAGTVLGKMGTTGMSTGKHLHWELRLGKQHIWDANGKNYIEPVAFFKAYIAKEKAIASAKVVATENDPVAPAPKHNASGAKAVETGAVAAAPAKPKPRGFTNAQLAAAKAKKKATGAN
jgi:murein DD-endopeptidase MepM/ murein hydrolase activator NlpD